MSWVKEALAGLKAGTAVTVQPFGGSMRGRIKSGQLVTLEPIDSAQLAVDDVIFVEWGNNYLLHLVTAMKWTPIVGRVGDVCKLGCLRPARPLTGLARTLGYAHVSGVC